MKPTHDFYIPIDRSRMQRRYVLIELPPDGEEIRHPPLTYLEFRDHFGFDPEWPYKENPCPKQI